MEVKILTHLCRICLSDNHLLPIFDTNLSQQICDKIMACAAVHVALGDPLPHQICKQCHRALEISHLFKTKCEQTDRQLRSIIQNQSTLLNSQSTTNTSIKSVQINIEPSNVQIFHDLDNINISPKVPDFRSIIVSTTNGSTRNCCSPPDINPIYTFSNLSKNLITVSSAESISSNEIDQGDRNFVDCGDYSIEDQVEQFHSEIENFDEMSSSYKQGMQNIVPEDESQEKIVNKQNIENLAPGEEPQEKIVQQSNGDIVMYFDNEDFHLGEECEVITDDISTPELPREVSSVQRSEDENHKEKIVPKGRFVLIKSVIKPQNIHYVTMDDFRNKENSKLIPIKQIKKENLVEVKSEIPEPASYIETETEEIVENCEEIFEETPSISDKDPFTEEPEIPIKENVKEEIPVKSSPPRDDIKYKGRGRPKKSDKYKPPQGVSYLKSGRKNVPVFVRTRKTKRTRYSYVKDIDDRKSSEIYTKPMPIVKRARVEKIIPPKRYDEKKADPPNRKLSTNMLLSDFNKLNDPQKQVLYQRLKLQNFRPTSKKDICERGIPKPLYFVSPKLSEESDNENDEDDKKQRTTSISDDLAIIQQSSGLYKDQTIDQDLKLINGTEFSPQQEKIETPAKTGRHTAIKSKRPQKRNHLENYSDPQKIEIELKYVPRKSERQRSPKKIFPEIDLFASPKKKIIEIPEESDEPNYEIQSNETNYNKFKIKIRRNLTKSTSSDEDVDEASKGADNNTILSDYYNEIEVETENDEESNSNSIVVKKILEKERVKLDYGAGLSCNVCNKSFPYRSHLIRHVRTHTGLKPYTCEYCKKCFTSLSSLNIHVKNHIGDLPYSCEVCKRGFAQPSVLKRHMLSHTGEHPYQCEICYKTFVHDSSLKTHLKMHTIKEPQHKCDICEKKFKYLSTLTSHLKTHSGIKPFTCPECRKAFYRRSLLARHMRSHTKERPYKCKLCKARFAYSGGLSSHKKLHTGIRPYECELCNFTFFRMSHLKNHMQKIHNNGVLLNCQRCNMNFDSKPLFKKHLSLHIKREQNLNEFIEDQQPDAEDS